MSSSINRHFTPVTLLQFAAPSIIMMVFMSLYTIVDGVFISRFVGSNALSSLNIVFPVINVVIAIGTMFATGGNAIISKYLGENKPQRARACLTQFVIVGVVVSIIIAALTMIFLDPICYFLGSNDELLSDCRIYLTIGVLFGPACILQSLFQSFFVTAERPGFGLALTIAGGLTNIVMDYVLIVPCSMGIAGAAIATGLGQMIPAVAGLIFFMIPNKPLHFAPFSFHTKEILSAAYNGSSEMVGQLSTAIVTIMFNIILMRLAGSSGVAAITILMYGQFLFNAFYLGYAIGIAPIVGFQYGAHNHSELKNVYKITYAFTVISSVIVTIAAVFLATPIVSVFTKEADTFRLANEGFKIFAINFLFSGINIVSSGFFTALSNGKISALISFGRTLVFTVIFLITLPNIIGVTGAWIAVPAAEAATFIVSLLMLIKYFHIPGPKNYFCS